MGTKGGAVVTAFEQTQIDDQFEEELARAADEQLQRLEDTDPSTDDGRWGGDRCVHGTYVGTPGGADFMCGLCEDGLDYWVEDPSYELMIGLNDGPAFVAGSAHWLSNIAKRDRWALRRLVLLRRDIRTFSQLIEDSNRQAVPTFQMRLADSGRWEDPMVNVKTNVMVSTRATDWTDIGQAVADQLGVPGGSVYLGEWGEEVERRSGYVYTDVEAQIDRRDLTEEQLRRVAAFEVTK